MSVILGLNSDHPGSSAALIVDGRPVMAVAEERLNRHKHYAQFPFQAIELCLRAAGASLADIDAVAVGRDPKANVLQKALFTAARPARWTHLAGMAHRRARLSNLRELLATHFEIDPSTLRFEQVNVEHHLAHTASAYLASGWDRATACTIDGSGDFVTCMVSECEGSEIRVRHRVFVPESLGTLYTMICQFIGFGEYGDEGKVMGLAPYGVDTYHEMFEQIISVRPNGDIALNNEWFVPFGASHGIRIDADGSTHLDVHYSDRFVRKFGAPRRPDEPISQRDKDLACGVQHAFERAYLALLNAAHNHAPSEKVAIAGGCALNSVANGMIFRETPFTETWIQPAAGDEGLSLGAALYAAHVIRKEPRRWEMKDSYLGPEFSSQEIRAALDQRGVRYQALSEAECLDRTSDAIMSGKVVGWFQGRMEWGPRALGNRSILAHPGLAGMKEILNDRIKRREWFRPFAPSVLAERQHDLFEQTQPSPFMLHVYKIKPEWRERLQAVNHIDNTGRLQTVSRDENPLYHALISRFAAKSGVPAVLNTSFNENEPVVCRPEQAIDCFLRTRMDALTVGPFFCEKT